MLLRLSMCALTLSLSASAWAGDLCKGKKPGSITFFSEEIERDKSLPEPAKELDWQKPMFALACLTDKAGPQAEGGKKFRVVLYVKQINLPDGKYSAYAKAKQLGIVRPQLSVSRGDIILSIKEDFDETGLSAKLDAGDYEFRLQAASEKATDKVDITFDLKNDVAYLQQLRKAGYLADGTIKVVKP